MTHDEVKQFEKKAINCINNIHISCDNVLRYLNHLFYKNGYHYFCNTTQTFRKIQETLPPNEYRTERSDLATLFYNRCKELEIEVV